jgi:alpha-mannosidase
MSREPRRIFVVFKSHLDVGFTGLIQEVLDSYSQLMVPRALEACRQSMAADPGHAFSWTLPAWLLERCLHAMEGSPNGEELKQRVQEGRISWHALPLTTHTELFGLEDLIRGLYIGRGLQERFGRAAVAAKMTDVPGHTWILPTLLSAAGVTFLHLGCNPCSTPPDVPRLFRWEGPDGSRVTTMYSQGGYGTPVLPPEDWELPVWLALQHTSDNVGPQRADAIREIFAAVRARFPRTQVTIGSLDDFARALTELKPDLPVVRKDLADSWIHGIGSMPAEVARLRAARNRLVQLESAMSLRLAADRAIAGPAALRQGSSSIDGAAQAIRAAYEGLLLFGEHTWGMDTKLALNPPEFGGRVYPKDQFQAVLRSGKYDRIIRSWDDKRAFVSSAEAQIDLLDSLLRGTQDLDAPPVRLEVTNHHLWVWNGLVPLGVNAGDEVSVVSETDGAEVSSLVVDGQTFAMVRGLSPLSSIHLTVTPARRGALDETRRGRAVAREQGKGVVLENSVVRVRVSREGGGIVSLLDKRSGREWVDRRAGVPFGSYRYDVYSRREIVSYLKAYAYDLEPWFLDDFGKPGYPSGEHRTFQGALVGVETENGSGWARIHLSLSQDPESVRDFGNARDVRQTVTLFDDLPFADLSCTVTAKEACPLLEAGHLVMPLRAETPRYAVNKTGSVMDPAADIARDANRLLYCCDRWVDVRDGGEGFLIIPMDSPLFSIGSPAIEAFDGCAGPGRPVLFFNLFNTQWGTNFPQWMAGNFRSRFRLMPHPGDWKRARAWEHAAAAFQPPECRVVPARDSQPLPSLLEAPELPLETVTLKPAEAGDGIILRLRDPSGRAGKRTLRFQAPPGASRPKLVVCSLLEDEGKPVSLSQSGDTLRASLTLRPFEVVTLKLKY